MTSFLHNEMTHCSLFSYRLQTQTATKQKPLSAECSDNFNLKCKPEPANRKTARIQAPRYQRPDTAYVTQSISL